MVQISARENMRDKGSMTASAPDIKQRRGRRREKQERGIKSHVSLDYANMTWKWEELVT